ncbi:MAG: DUF4860 domain-containing protein [Clostridia bacterium]|nr:DUF4860 domain-containing protein [Clostridia bacterium]
MSNGNMKVQHGMQGTFIFVLLGLFALMSTLMVLLGAQMYRATVDRSQYNNENRVMGAYVRSMVRSLDSGEVSVEEPGGIPAVALKETWEGEQYVTWIYQYDGALYEQYTDMEDEFNPERGTEICPANSLSAALEDGLLTVRLTNAHDEPCTVRVALRCAG